MIKEQEEGHLYPYSNNIKKIDDKEIICREYLKEKNITYGTLFLYELPNHTKTEEMYENLLDSSIKMLRLIYSKYIDNNEINIFYKNKENNYNKVISYDNLFLNMLKDKCPTYKDDSNREIYKTYHFKIYERNKDENDRIIQIINLKEIYKVSIFKEHESCIKQTKDIDSFLKKRYKLIIEDKIYLTYTKVLDKDEKQKDLSVFFKKNKQYKKSFIEKYEGKEMNKLFRGCIIRRNGRMMGDNGFLGKLRDNENLHLRGELDIKDIEKYDYIFKTSGNKSKLEKLPIIMYHLISKVLKHFRKTFPNKHIDYFNPVPVNPEPKPVPVNPKPVPINPKPVPINPEPKQVNPEPKQVNPKAVPINPEPKPVPVNPKLDSFYHNFNTSI